jgi:Tol biopolymer transport system component
LYHALFILNTTTLKLVKVEDTYAFGTYRTWVGTSLVYERYPVNGVGCPDLKSYTPNSMQTSTLISAAGTESCPKLIAPYDDGFYYSISASTPDKDGIYFGQLGGKTAKRVAETPSSQVVRKAKHTLLSVYYSYTPDYTAAWQTIDLENMTAVKVANGPSSATSRAYNDSPGKTYSSFIEERDGKTELYLTDSKGENEKKLTSLGSVNQFVNWVGDDYVIFSVTKSDENALYVASTHSGKVRKLTDFFRANSRTYGGGSNPTY